MKKPFFLVAYLPHILTFCGLLCGIGGLISISIQGDFLRALYWGFAAALFDLLDGLAARKLRAVSAQGAALDALSDAISFGLLPAWASFYFLRTQTETLGHILPPCAFVFTLAALWRLARFLTHTKPSQTDPFYGLPTPIAALFILSICAYPHDLIFSLEIALIATTALMISPWPCVSFKFKNLQWHPNKTRYALIALFVLLIPFARQFIFLIFTPLYLIVSLIFRKE